ncbi:hypothetical protein [Nonomuraea sp. NPDC050202]|uniref:hypothetical protein n=1 Tax=Nonomuraea sp. NPDC050202 TaxID=3155035 RepID=UPI003409D576
MPDPLAVGAALLDAVSERPRSGPLRLIVDDVHWADEPTLRALTFCLRRLRVDRVPAVLMLRDAAALAGPEGLLRLVAAGTTRRLRLSGLRAPEVGAMAGGLGAGPVSQRGLARLVAHTEGVPLHLRALLEEVPAAAQDDLGQPLPAPRSYGLLVLGKVARCAPPGAGQRGERARPVVPAAPGGGGGGGGAAVAGAGGGGARGGPAGTLLAARPG